MDNAQNEKDVKALFIIVNAGFAEGVLDIARQNGSRGATIMNARGEGFQHKSFLGITIDTEKELILSVNEVAVAEKVMAAIQEKAGVDTPAHAICFMMPIETVSGIVL